MKRHLRKHLSILPALIAFIFNACGVRQDPTETTHGETEKTAFQTASPWKPTIDVCADVAIIYGCTDSPEHTFEKRVASWRDKGYKTHFMTGIAWGEYQDYFSGKWDGKTHYDEGQMTRYGDTIWHGPGVPYIVPTPNFLKYLKERHISRAIDAGIDAIYLEEPEFWTRAGYSESFKREWNRFYGSEWQPPHLSAHNTYLSNKLKYHLYYKALEECFTYAREYGKSKGMKIRCFVPTHSLINYSQWEIVSPEASLASLDCVDGYIAQVWTGTARQPNLFNGQLRERVFETAFLEYGCMQSMTAPTGRKVYFLTDPIEDRPRDWEDYKRNYEATFTAKLLYPANDQYEVMPWPDRIYEGSYLTREDGKSKEPISRSYSTQMQVMINALNQIPVTANKVCGPAGISVLMGNSLMFQRSPDSIAGYADEHFSNFYGFALPLLKRGVPVNIVHLENLGYPNALQDTRILLMSYSNMKPHQAQVHQQIAAWVKTGGILIYAGRDEDPYQNVPEWWNNGTNPYEAPSEHLFESLNMARKPGSGEYLTGRGRVCVIREDPKTFIMQQDADSALIGPVYALYNQLPGNPILEWKNYFTLGRGPYDIISVMNESVDTEAYCAKGHFIDLFDPNLPILQDKEVHPGQQAFLFNLDRIENPEMPQVLASAARILNEYRDDDHYRFIARGPLNTDNVMRIRLPERPRRVRIKTAEERKSVDAVSTWDNESKTLLLKFGNEAEGVSVSLKW